MLFSEPVFLFFFLPAVLFAYFVLGERHRDLVLLVFSLLFYAWGERAYVLVLGVSIVLNWICGRGAAPERGERRSRAMLITAILGNLLLLVAFKYTSFLIDNLNVLLTSLRLRPLGVGPVHLPIGISFFAFQGMSYVVDVHRGTVPPQRSLLKIAMYKSFFPQLIAGPIVRYVDVKSQIERRSVGIDDFGEGVRRFIIGLGKKMMIANVVARPTDAIFALPLAQLNAGLTWIAVVGYALQIYFDFSAYSDMAIGLGRMFGFRFLENFNYPYIAVSMTDFWRRWHISLSSWFRDYLYIPLGGNRVSPARRYANLMVVFALCGLWHGASWNFVIWGLFHGFFLILERLKLVQRMAAPLRPLRHLYVVLVVLVSWVFFRADTLTSAMSFLRAMADVAHPTQAAPGIRLFVDNEVILAALVGIVGSAPILPALRRRLEAASVPRSWDAARMIGLMSIFIYSVMLMAAGSYSPFIYFRF
ncbi:MAG: alginate O-acetyltransferase complex protein AlgI [Myxococcales bacterium]|jgi:alginate O-acetyltransferase complex protein AlgI|nr:alginate O-acetyltransferase complex protein AlgI [Myxococcales bacterium]